MNQDVVEVAGHSINISNEDKILFPGDGITKGDIIDYYRRIAKTMLPLVRDHPLMMHRFPEGLKGEGFIQKNASDYFPDWIKTVAVAREGDGETCQVVARDEATLVYLAGQACLTPHILLCRKDKLNYPDRMVFDIDPGNKFRKACQIACQLRDILAELGMKSFVMTTGSKGLHVVTPLDRRSPFDAVRTFAREVARIVVDRYPRTATLEHRISARRKRVYIDILRNGFGQTAVAPFAVRAKRGAPVAAPVAWREVEDVEIQPAQFTVKNIFPRLKEKQNPWAGFFRSSYSLANAQKQLSREFKPSTSN